VRVTDSSALVKYYAREPSWERIRKVVLEDVVTLELAVIEVANALWKKVLRSEMSFDFAREIVEDLTIRRALLLVVNHILQKPLELLLNIGLQFMMVFSLSLL
jgi:predicted nucleic acid-binding protein